MMKDVNPAKGKILELESIRGLAALLVFFHHMPQWNDAIYGIGMIRNGQLMVDLFFVLSGYVIYANYGDRIHDFRQLLRFQFLRLGRLYPIHIVVLGGFFLAEIAKFIAQSRFGLQFGRAPFEAFLLGNLLANLSLTQALGFSPDLTSINGPSWSISVEFYTYMLFAVITVYAAPFRSVMYAMISAVALFMLAFSSESYFQLHADLLRGLSGFFIGCLTAIYSSRDKQLQVPVVFQEAVIVFVLVFLSFMPEGRLLDLLIYPISAALILATVHGGQGALKKILLWPPVIAIGTISYSLYMWHYLVIWSVDNFFVHLISKFWVPAAWLQSFIAYASAVLITLMVSFIAYHYIEQPFREKSRKLAAAWFDR